MPFFGLESCPPSNVSCTGEGILMELFELMEEMYNFTLRVDRADGWGAVPKVTLHFISRCGI